MSASNVLSFMVISTVVPRYSGTSCCLRFFLLCNVPESCSTKTQASRNAEMTEHEGIRDFGNPAAVEHAAL
jgi:hypothetical protein